MQPNERTWHRFFFSDRREDRLLRHVSFWTIWWLYLSFYKWFEQRPSSFAFYVPSFGNQVLLKTFLILCVQALGCYFTLYVLLPRFRANGSIFQLAVGSMTMLLAIYLGGYALHHWAFPIIDPAYSHIPDMSWAIIYNTLVVTPKIIAPAVGIKYFKYWRQKQSEMERLEKEKAENALKLLTSRLRPEFMLGALCNIQEDASKGSSRAQSLLIKFSDLLSYIIYECDVELVPMEREVNMMLDYLYMKNLSPGSQRELHVRKVGNMEARYMPPFLILPIIDLCFRISATLPEHRWLDLEIGLEGDRFMLKVIHGMPPGDQCDTLALNPDIQNLRKRLDIIYRENQQFKLFQEGEMAIASLDINTGNGLGNKEGIQKSTTSYPQR